MAEDFETMLTGGHPNSLGRTLKVVEVVLADPDRFGDLFACYGSDDAVVRLRTSNAMKRLAAARPDLLVPYIDRLIDEVGALDQASAQWTLAQLFGELAGDMDPAQRMAALAIMKRNLAEHEDWIVLNMTMETLSAWAQDDPDLRTWLLPHLKRLASDRRKSIKGRAEKKLRALGAV
ncbi:MAG: hypothetical protein QNJ84_07870 [Alphaproteobacteria bacterium]|nr:hypothetical protein [Alphaproteobacteria bacterium]